MKNNRLHTTRSGAVLAFSASLALVMMTAAPASAASAAVYDSMPSPYPPHFISQPFEAEQTNEFGDEVTLGGTNRNLDNVVISFDSWACETGQWNLGNCVTTPDATFTHPITMNIYETNSTDATLPGALLTTVTDDVTVPYRPSSDPQNCSTATMWYDPVTDDCYNGLAFNWTFDFASQNIVLPNTVIVTIAFNTNTYGADPIGSVGDYDALNVSLTPDTPSIGSQVANEMFWNTATASRYADGGAGGTNTLRKDVSSTWSTYGGLPLTINASAPAAGPGLADTGVDTAAMTAGAWIAGGVLAAGIALFGFAAYRKRAARH